MEQNFDLILFESKLNPKEIGERIRYYRNKKKLSLRDLANQDIFSLGKLSNIENGLVPVNLNDIKTICDFLGIPIEHVVDPNRVQKMNSLRLDIYRAKTYIFLQLFDSAKKILDETTNEIKEEKFLELEFHLNFVWGLYYVGIEQYNDAESCLIQALNYDNQSDKDIDGVKLQIQNTLMYISFEQGKMNKAKEIGEKAIQFINKSPFKLDNDDKSFAYFNLAVSSCCLGHFDSSLQYAQTALSLSEGILKHQIVLLKSIIFALKNEYEAALDLTIECLELFRKAHDINGFIKALQFQYYLLKNFSHPEHIKAIHHIEKEIPNDIHIQNARNLNDQLELYQLIIQIAISENDNSLAEKFLEKCFELEGQDPGLKTNYKTYYLAAQFEKKRDQNAPKQREFLEKANKLLGDDKSTAKALIMYELALLSIDEYNNNPLLVEASNLIFQHYAMDFGDLEMIKHIIPKPRY
nr:helix-turn-helix transcriptional regulator [Ammoniphilus resinae]